MVKTERTRVLVIMGGTSNEREVSLASGRNIAEGLRRAGYNVDTYDVTDEKLARISRDDLDVAFIALHGRFGEDGRIQRVLEEKGIAYTGSSPKASRLAMDKVLAKKAFDAAGVATPRWLEVPLSSPVSAESVVARLGLPLVAKPAREGSSIGVVMIHDEKDVADALATALAFDDVAIVERKITGRELTVGILDETPLPVCEIVPVRSFYDYTAKYEDDATDYVFDTGLSSEATEAVQELSLSAHRLLGCSHFSRVDLMMDESGKAWVLEVNTIPGFTNHSLLPKAAAEAKINFSELCSRIVQLALTGVRKGQADGEAA